jgi:hypothetical protein
MLESQKLELNSILNLLNVVVKIAFEPIST